MHLMTGPDQTECIRPFELAHGEKAPNRAYIGEKMGCYLNCVRIFGVLLERLKCNFKKMEQSGIAPKQKIEPATFHNTAGAWRRPSDRAGAR